jgi:hypothetical protein
MTLPTPEDPANAAVWENYVISQVTQASLGIIPRNAMALGVEVRGYAVTLRCQLRVIGDEDEADLDDIVSDLEALVGDKIHVSRSYEICSEPKISPHDGVCWTYVVRL